jgi:hypothetical protein
MFSTTEAAEVEQSFVSSREGNTHAIKKKDDRWSHVTHCLGRWLIRQEVAAVNGVVKMFPGGIAFALGVNRAVNSALSANRMRTFHWNYGKKINGMSSFGNSHGRGETCKAASYNPDLRSVARH